VTHSHPLHVDVEAQCLCCRSMQPFRFSSPADQVVCPFCAHHLGPAKADKRDRDHVALWVELHAELWEAHAGAVAAAALAAEESRATIAGLRAQVGELTEAIASEFTRAPAAGVRDALGSELLSRAERRSELLYRRLDRVMAALWRVDLLHHDAGDTAGCSCGAPAASCAEARAIGGERQELRAWESRNLQLLRDGKRHALPADHPAIAGPPNRSG